MASRNSVVGKGPFMISSNAGPGPVAGKLCHEDFFSTSWQNDQTTMAMGEVLNQLGIKNLYIMAPNYAAGKNMVAGVTRTFKGNIVGKDMTKFPAQIDFSAELAKSYILAGVLLAEIILVSNLIPIFLRILTANFIVL